MKPMNSNTRTFVGDLLWSAGLSGALMWLGYGSLHAMPLGAAMALVFSPIILFGLLYGGAVAVVLYGLASGRIGVVVGPVAMFLTVLSSLQVWSSHSQSANVREMQALDSRDFRSPNRDHELVAIAWEGSNCDSLCMQLIATSFHAVAIENRETKIWTEFRKAEGEQCYTGQNARSLLDFLRAGFSDICAISTERTRIDDALVIRIPDWREISGKPRNGFNGVAYELVERQGGKDRLLGRWLYGRVFPTSGGTILLGGGPGPVEIGTEFTRAEFYAAALNTPLSDLHAPGTADLPTLLDAVERLMGNPALRTEALSVYRDVARRGDDSRIEFLRPRIERFLNSNDPELVLIGLAVLDSVRGLDLNFARPHLQRMFDSGDPAITAAALRALFAFRIPERGFAKPQLIELAFSPMLHEDKSNIHRSLMANLQEFSGPFPPEVRARAKMLFLEDQNLSRVQRWMLLGIMAHGGAAMRQEASEVLFSLRVPVFEDAVLSVGWRIGTTDRNRWRTRDRASGLLQKSSNWPKEQQRCQMQSSSGTSMRSAGIGPSHSCGRACLS